MSPEDGCQVSSLSLQLMRKEVKNKVRTVNKRQQT